MKVLKPGKPWSIDIDCSRCKSILRATAESLEYYDAKQSVSGVGFTCPVCHGRDHLPPGTELPPAVEELVKRRKGLAPKLPEVIKRGKPRNFKVVCGTCEAELLVEPEDVSFLQPDSYRTRCAACLSEIALSPSTVPEELKKTLKGEADTLVKF